MRQKKLVSECEPCDTDYTNKSIQTIADAKQKGPVSCPNLSQCNDIEGIQCYRRIGQQMAKFILNCDEIHQALQNEKIEYLEQGPEGKFWVLRDDKWQVVKGKKNVIDDITKFAELIIDLRPDEHRSLNGKRTPELGPADAMHNSLLDIADDLTEIQKNM